MVVLDMVDECFEVFGVKLGAHRVGHVGEDGVGASAGAREEFPALKISVLSGVGQENA